MENELQTAINLVKAGKKAEAGPIFSKIVKYEPDNEQAWLGLSVCVAQEEQKKYCLKQALRINPRNNYARNTLASLEFTPVFQSSDQESKTTTSIQPETTKECPLCRSQMPFNARVCPTCGKDIINEKHDNLYRVANSISSISTALIVAGILLPICVCLIGALLSK